MDIYFIISLLALGAFVGFVAGLLGIGGGGIMVPMLTTLFLWQGLMDTAQVMHFALGTSMASIVITSFSSMHAHHRAGGIRWPIVKTMAPGILVGTFLTTFLVAKMNTLILAVIFAVFMFCVAIQMLLNIKPTPERVLPKVPVLLATGTGIGGFSALVSIGGGTLSVPFLYWHNIAMKQAISTSAALGFPIAISGSFGYIVHGWQASNSHPSTFGFIYLPAVLVISCVSVLTAPLGVRYAYRLPVATLKKIFAVLLFALSINMLVALQ